MQSATRGELENCRQCGGQMCLRPDRVCCSVCGLIAPEPKAESPAPKAVAKQQVSAHAAHAEPVGAPHGSQNGTNNTPRKK